MSAFTLRRSVAAVLGSIFFTTLLVSPYDAAELGRVALQALQMTAQGSLSS